MPLLSGSRAFALNNFYALDRLEVPGRQAMSNLAGRAKGMYGPTGFADGCAEHMALEPVQADLRFLPQGGDPVLGFDALLAGRATGDGDPLARLSQLLRLSYGLLRWEPFNDYKQHRAVASPRSLYPLALYVLPGEGAPEPVHLYLPDYHALAVCPGLCPPAGMGPGFAMVGRLGHLPPYGELTPTLTGVEAGALTRQIALMAQVFGQAAVATPPRDAGAFRAALGLEHWSDCPLAMVEVEGADLAQALASMTPRAGLTMQRKPRHTEMEIHQRLHAYVDFAETPVPVTTCPAPRLPDDSEPLPSRRHAPCADDVAQVIRRRSSGCRVGGLVGERPGADRPALTEILSDAVMLRGVGARVDGPALRLFLTVFNDPQLPRGDHEITLDEGRWRTIACADRSAMHTFGSYYEVNFDTLSAVLTIACDLDGEGADHPAFFTHAHLVAGGVVQDIGLAAAANGFFARPYRSFRGPVMQGVLGQDCEPLLQVLLGRNRRHNLRVGVGQ